MVKTNNLTPIQNQPNNSFQLQQPKYRSTVWEQAKVSDWEGLRTKMFGSKGTLGKSFHVGENKMADEEERIRRCVRFLQSWAYSFQTYQTNVMLLNSDSPRAKMTINDGWPNEASMFLHKVSNFFIYSTSLISSNFERCLPEFRHSALNGPTRY